MQPAKDGTLKHVMSGVNPQGCQVYSFKAPSAEDLNHDFLWRLHEMGPGAYMTGASIPVDGGMLADQTLAERHSATQKVITVSGD